LPWVALETESWNECPESELIADGLTVATMKRNLEDPQGAV